MIHFILFCRLQDNSPTAKSTVKWGTTAPKLFWRSARQKRSWPSSTSNPRHTETPRQKRTRCPTQINTVTMHVAPCPQHGHLHWANTIITVKQKRIIESEVHKSLLQMQCKPHWIYMMQNPIGFVMSALYSNMCCFVTLLLFSFLMLSCFVCFCFCFLSVILDNRVWPCTWMNV